jgi:hypothetical protein
MTLAQDRGFSATATALIAALFISQVSIVISAPPVSPLVRCHKITGHHCAKSWAPGAKRVRNAYGEGLIPQHHIHQRCILLFRQSSDRLSSTMHPVVCCVLRPPAKVLFLALVAPTNFIAAPLELQQTRLLNAAQSPGPNRIVGESIDLKLLDAGRALSGCRFSLSAVA